MHIVHEAVNGSYDGKEYTTADEMEDETGTAVYSIFFEELYCEEILPEEEYYECMEKRKVSDDFFK